MCRQLNTASQRKKRLQNVEDFAGQAMCMPKCVGVVVTGEQ